MDTPWGISDYVDVLLPGVVIVSTASHGGMMLTNESAKELLTPQAISKGLKYLNCVCFEEDCDIVIPIFELPQIWVSIYENVGDLEERKQKLLGSLSCWNADYLIARGIEPLPEQYEQYKKNQEIFNRQ